MHTTLMPEQHQPILDTFEAIQQHFQPQVDKIYQQGIGMLEEAEEALIYFEGMPDHLSHQLAHDAANELRQPKTETHSPGIIPILKSSFTDVFKSFTADIPSAVSEQMDPSFARYKYEHGIERALVVIQEQRARLDKILSLKIK